MKSDFEVHSQKASPGVFKDISNLSVSLIWSSKPNLSHGNWIPHDVLFLVLGQIGITTSIIILWSFQTAILPGQEV